MATYHKFKVVVTEQDGYTVGTTDNEYEIELLARAIVAKANADRKFTTTVDRIFNPDSYFGS